MGTTFYKDGDNMPILTDAPTEQDFLLQASDVIAQLIENGKHDGDWYFQFRFWLQHIVEICCKYRGYKADVKEFRVIVAGEKGNISAPVIGQYTHDGKVVLEAE